MGVCMKTTSEQLGESMKGLFEALFNKNNMPINWIDTFWDTFNSVGISYFGLKGIDAMNEATDLGSDEANKLRKELFFMYFSETFNRKSSGLKAEKAFHAKMTKRYQEGKAITAVPDPLDLVHLSIAYLGDMPAIIMRYGEANLISEHVRFDMYSSLGKAQFWAGVLRGQLVAGQVNSLSINASKAAKKMHEKHYEMRDALQFWWKENRSQFKTQEKAILEAMDKFNVSYSTAGKHIRKSASELRAK